MGFLVHIHSLHDGLLRDCEALAADPDDQRRGDRERQRNLEDELGAVSLCGLQRDCPANAFDVGADDIHAHAPAGHSGNSLGRGEAGLQDEAIDLLVAHAGDGSGIVDASLDRFLADAVGIETTSIVGDFDVDLAEIVEGCDRYLSCFRFAGGDPFGGRFDPVIRAVANQMRQRIADRLDQLAIELGIGALDDKIEFLLQLD